MQPSVQQSPSYRRLLTNTLNHEKTIDLKYRTNMEETAFSSSPPSELVQGGVVTTIASSPESEPKIIRKAKSKKNETATKTKSPSHKKQKRTIDRSNNVGNDHDATDDSDRDVSTPRKKSTSSSNNTSMDPQQQQQILQMPRVHVVGRFWTVKPLHEKPLRRLQGIHGWFTDERIETLLMPLTRQTDKLSLRALDWLVTNYAKKRNIVLVQKPPHPPVNIFADYRSMLGLWRRRNFDPFRRAQGVTAAATSKQKPSSMASQRIYFMWRDKNPETGVYGSYQVEETTLGQLNFLYWAETNGIIKYAREHVTEIETDMAKCMSQVKASKKLVALQGIKRKRCELSKAPKARCFLYHVPMEITFDAQPSPAPSVQSSSSSG